MIRQAIVRAWRWLRGPTAAEFDAIWARYQAAMAAVREYDQAQRDQAVLVAEEPDPWMAGYLATPELAEGEYAPGYRAARDVEPFTTIMHPNPGGNLPGGEPDDREVLDVVDVREHDGWATFTCASGPPVTVAADWPVALDTPADAEHRKLIWLAVALDVPDAGPGTGRSRGHSGTTN